MRQAWTLSWVLVSFLVGEPSAAGASDTVLEPLVRPSLDRFEPAVKTLLGERHEALAALLAIDSGDSDEAARELGEMGRLYLGYNLSEAAESCFANAQLLVPEAFEWPYFLGIIRQDRGALDAAAAALERALELRAGDAPAQTRLAQIEFERGNSEKAETLYGALLKAAGYEAVASYGLGRVALDDGRLEDAISRFESAVEAQPDASQPVYQLAIAYRRDGQVDRARQLLENRGRGRLAFPDPLVQGLGEEAEGVEIFLSAGRRARVQGDFDAALAAFQRAITEEPDEPRHWSVLGATLLEAGREEEAVRAFQEVLTRAPDDDSARYNLALAELALGNVPAASGHLEQLTSQHPDHVDGRVNLATLYEAEGRFGEAERLLSEAIELDPYETGLEIHRASVLTSLGRTSEARTALVALLREDPGNPEALVVLGAANEELGSMEEAVDAWREAIEGGAAGDVAGRARFFLGRALLGSGDPRAAVGELRLASLELPDNVELRFVLAGALGALQDFEAAALEYAAVLERDPGHESARFGRALSLLFAGQEATARKHLEESVRTTSGSVALKHLLARVLATAGDDKVRDGIEALRLAQEVFQAVQTLEHAETLAMAYANLGQFEAALDWQTRIIERAQATGVADRVPQLTAARESYERGEAVRTPWARSTTNNPSRNP